MEYMGPGSSRGLLLARRVSQAWNDQRQLRSPGKGDVWKNLAGGSDLAMSHPRLRSDIPA